MLRCFNLLAPHLFNCARVSVKKALQCAELLCSGFFDRPDLHVIFPIPSNVMPESEFESYTTLKLYRGTTFCLTDHKDFPLSVTLSLQPHANALKRPTVQRIMVLSLGFYPLE